MRKQSSYIEEGICKKKYEELTKEYEAQKAALEKAIKEKVYKTGKATKMLAYLEAMKQVDDFLEEWSDEAWILMVETATMNRKNHYVQVRKLQGSRSLKRRLFRTI